VWAGPNTTIGTQLSFQLFIAEIGLEHRARL